MRTMNSILQSLRRGVARAPSKTVAVGSRPDIIDLIGQNFDRDSAAPAKKTLIICSAPRTGSYELCRFLTAAGLGIPHEYFHPAHAQILARRWHIGGNPLGESMGSYIERLQNVRATNDVFSFKLQYWQFNEFLRNEFGASLFRDAHIVHLYRSNIADQLASYHFASHSGVWDYSARQTTEPLLEQRDDLVIAQLAALTWEDAGFRRLFAMMSINPMFVTTEGLFEEPRSVLHRLAQRLNVVIDDSALENMISKSAPYSRGHLPPGISERLKKLAFEKDAQI
jgi:LPS sulfotransferase NodH